MNTVLKQNPIAMRLLILAFILSISFSGLAQLDHRFIDTLSTWKLEYTNWDGIDLIQGYTYYNFSDINYEDDSISIAEWELYSSNDEGLYIEDKINHRVSWVYGSDTIVLYDFSLNIGDTLKTDALENLLYPNEFCFSNNGDLEYWYVVVDSGFTTVNNQSRYTLFTQVYCYDSNGLVQASPSDTIAWIDGMGHTEGPNYLRTGTIFETGVFLACYQYDSVLAFGTNCDPLGVKKSNGSASFNAFPNPFINQVYFNFQGQLKSLEIYDISGRLVPHSVYSEKTIELQHLPSGLYILKANVDGDVINKRLIKQ